MTFLVKALLYYFGIIAFGIGIVFFPVLIYETINKGEYLVLLSVIILFVITLIYPLYYTKKVKVFETYDRKSIFLKMWVINTFIILIPIILINLLPSSISKTKLSDNILSIIFFSFSISSLGSLIGFIKLYFSDKKIQEEYFKDEAEYEAQERERIEKEKQQEKEDKELQREFYQTGIENNKLAKYESLEKLAELLEKNIITKEEFDEQKKQILGND